MHGTARAQTPQSDTGAARRDTTAARGDTMRVRGDTASVAVPPRADSIRVDSTRVDSTRIEPSRGRQDTTATKAPRDTVKAPLARAESPTLRDVGVEYRWDRSALFASGALTLLELLERAPGVTALRAGWITAPASASYLGTMDQVRIFFDGVELDPLDARTGGVHDLAAIQLWMLEEVAIERGADELRVYLRSWRSDRTTPYSRTDVLTGDQNTNLFRGFFARRFRHGEAMQLAAQQLSTDNERSEESGDALSLFARAGWARGRWSADAFVHRTHRTRSAQPSLTNTLSIPALDASNTEAYVRASYGDLESGLWVQLIAGSVAFKESTAHSTATDVPGVEVDTADTTTSRAQYVTAAGYSRGPIRLSATNRLRVFSGKRYSSPSLRASVGFPWVTAGVYAERSALDSTTLAEASVRLEPFPFVAVSGAVSQRRATGSGSAPTSRNLRGEAGLRVGGVWLIGGVLQRDSAALAPPTVFDTSFVAVSEGRATGTYAGVRGRLWKSIGADAVGIQWTKAGFYRPQYQARSQIYVRSNWLSRFPSGNFGIFAAATHEYQDRIFYPTTSGTQHVAGHRVISTLLEIRILSGIVSWQYRNILGDLYEVVPGFEMPRQTNVYGVRWEFWN